jgi:peptidoglycan/xylan/chitin deacetylase (PgdA/CDA1 family)
MRRHFVIIFSIVSGIALLSSLAVLKVSALSTNEIVNPSVETVSPTDSTMPQGWQTGEWGTNTAAFSYLTTGHTGTRSVKVQMTSYTSGDAKWYFTPEAVTAGSQYVFSDYYQATVPTDIVAQFDNGSGVYTYTDLGTVAASTPWTQASETFTAPAGAKNVTVFHLINSVGSLTLDDASLTAGATASTPTVNLTSPAANATVSGTTALAATANDTNGISGVQFKVDGVNVGTQVTAAPYQTNWNTTTVTNGVHSLTAVATNTQGTTTTSTPVSVTVSNTVVTPPPTTTNIVPNPSVETPDPADSTVPQNWLTGGWGTNTSTYSYLNTGGQDGTHSVEVQTTAYTSGDAKWYFAPQAVTAGNQYSFSDYYKSSIPTDVTVQFDNGNGTYSYLDLGTAAASATTWKQFTGSFTVPTGMKNVTVFHLINGVGTLQTDDFSLTPVSAPTVAVTTPSGTVSGNSVKLTATASDTSGIKNVQFKVDGVNVGTALTASPYSTTWDSTTVTNGTHSVTAVATNNAGVSTTSSAMSVTVNNPVSSNLVPNPSVETADPNNASVPLDWQSNSWGTNTTAFSYLTTGGHTGKRAVQVKTTKYTDGDGKWFFNPVAVTPDTQYKFSDYYKATIATEVDVAFTMSDGSTVYQIIGLPEASSSTWANFTTTFTVPQGAVNMTVYHLIHGVGTLTLDDESLVPYTPVGFNRSLVTLTFDDGYDNEYTQGLPLLQKYGFNSTQFIITGLIGTTGYMTSAQVKSFEGTGSEMASHTVTHDDMLTETKTQYDSELSQSQTQLQQWIGAPVTDLAFPNGLYNKAIVTDTAKYYTGSRGVEDGLNSKDNFNVYDIKVQNVYNTTTTAQVADWVAQAQATKTWLVLVYHSIDPDLSNPVDSGIYNITPTQLDSQLAAVKSSGVTVETMQQAIAEVKPQL